MANREPEQPYRLILPEHGMWLADARCSAGEHHNRIKSRLTYISHRRCGLLSYNAAWVAGIAGRIAKVIEEV
ncbi:hypothetical protein B2M20_11225 [Nitrobacter vulgaris]|uniref:Uncharacterized protein n=1 Tax=Nitrobacter vulgaris TaxID=29421 RepID=A0A1V4HYI7_NITVU|nr:hypothetical protein B2M20_11225 [Nitrobacter vulgaris]